MADPSRQSASPSAMLASLVKNRRLIATLTRREIAGRYRGSALGVLWSVLTPVLMLAVYTFVFSKVFKQEVADGPGSAADFALYLFAGLLVFNMFSECVNRAPVLILNNANFVKRVVFPLEVLPVVTLLSACFHMLISVVIWLLLYVVAVGLPGPTALLLPLALLPALIVTLGVTWLLAALGVFVRDVAQFVAVLVMVLMFLSPIFYQLEAMPSEFRPVLYLSPLTIAIELVRDVMFWGRLPSALAYLGATALFLLLAWLGFAFFQRTRKGFADVL